jgi:hypothetical protein
MRGQGAAGMILASGRFPSRDKNWSTSMKMILMISAALTGFSAAAMATPVDEMVKQGFACEPGARGEVVCRKDGAPSKICNAEGSCFRIVYENGQMMPDSVKTGSVSGAVMIRPKH